MSYGGRFVDWVRSLTDKSTMIDGTEQVWLDDSGANKKATTLDLIRYVLANGFSAADLSIANRIYIKAATKTLTESSATGIVDIAVASGSVASGELLYSIQANDATDYQNLRGRVVYSIVNKGGTLTTNFAETAEANAVSTGTLTCTTTLVAGTNKITLSLNAVSSLTQTTLRAKWQMQHDGYATITAL